MQVLELRLKRIDGGRHKVFTTLTDRAVKVTELRTIGLAHVRAGDITENMIRAEHGLNIRGRYYVR